MKYKNVAIKVECFNEACALLEYNYDWSYAESEDKDCMRYDDNDASIWIRRGGGEVIIEGYMTEDLQKWIIKNIPGAEIYD